MRLIDGADDGHYSAKRQSNLDPVRLGVLFDCFRWVSSRFSVFAAGFATKSKTVNFREKRFQDALLAKLFSSFVQCVVRIDVGVH